MPYSVHDYIGDGTDKQFAINFTLGFLDRSHVIAQVAGEGSPRTITWINDGLVTIGVVDDGLAIEIRRITPKNTLQHDFSNGSILAEKQLDEGNLQTIMLAHEVLDGFRDDDAESRADFDLGGFKLIDVADGTDTQDAATFGQVGSLIALAAIASNPGVPNYTALKTIAVGALSDPAFVNVLGRVTQGDGGGDPFIWNSNALTSEVAADEVTVGEGDGGNFVAPTSDKTGASGAWVRLTNGLINPRHYGVIGDGVAVDTTAFAAANKAGAMFLPKGTYLITGAVTVVNSIFGEPGTIIKIDNTTQFTLTGSDVGFKDVSFDGGSSDIAEKMMYFPEGVTKPFLKNCRFYDMNGTDGGTEKVYPVWIELDTVDDFIIDGCEFDNVSSFDSDGVVGTGGGFAGGVYLQSTTKIGVTITAASSGVISNCRFKNIYTEDGAFSLAEDADAIRTLLNDSAFGAPDFNIRFIDNYFEDIQKSCIKLSGTPGITIDGVHNYHDRSDPDNVFMTAIVRVQYTRNTVVRNIKSTGRTFVVINAIGGNIQVSNVHHQTKVGSASTVESAQWVLQLQEVSGLDSDNISFDNIQVEGASGLIRTVPVADGSAVFRELTVSNVLMNNCQAAAAGDGFIQLHGCTRPTLSNIQIKDFNSRIIQMFELRDTDNLTVDSFYLRSISSMVRCEASSAGLTNTLTFRNGTFVKTGSASGDRFLQFRANGSGAVDNCVLENIRVLAPEFSAVGNDEVIFIEGSNALARNIVIVFTDGTGDFPRGGLALYNANNYHVSGITLKGDANYAGTCGAVYILGATTGRISDVYTNMDGVDTNGATLKTHVHGLTYLTGRQGVFGGGTTVTSTDVVAI